MAAIDSKVAHILDKQRASDDEDALLAELEEEDDVSHLREKRLEQLHQELSRAKALQQTQHGTYASISDEKELLSITTSTDNRLCIVHFSHPDFARCAYMDRRLEALAEKHYEARFVKINVENAPFLVVKLGVKVLPCVICFKEGVSTERIIGFEGIGWKEESFTVKELEGRLLKAGVLERRKVLDEDEQRRNRARERDREEDFDEDEWD